MCVSLSPSLPSISSDSLSLFPSLSSSCSLPSFPSLPFSLSLILISLPPPLSLKVFNNQVSQLFMNAERSAQQLVTLLGTNFPSYCDTSVYQGREGVIVQE